MMPLLFVVLSVVLVETETPLIQYLVNISHLCIPEKKYLIRGNVRSDKCHSANCATGKCPFREVSLRGTVLWGTIRWGNVFGEMSIGEKSVGEISSGGLPQNHFFWSKYKKIRGRVNSVFLHFSRSAQGLQLVQHLFLF